MAGGVEMQIAVMEKNGRVDRQSLSVKQWLATEELSRLRAHTGRCDDIYLECRDVPGRGRYVFLTIRGDNLPQAATASAPVGVGSAHGEYITRVQAACARAVRRMLEFLEEKAGGA
jgi:hypothetical protein